MQRVGYDKSGKGSTFSSAEKNTNVATLCEAMTRKVNNKVNNKSSPKLANSRHLR
jgi:hypothetical protein